MTPRTIGFYVFEIAGFASTGAVLTDAPWWACLIIGVLGWTARMTSQRLERDG